MSEWWTYSLTDFLLFSPRTYSRLFALYNEAVWPAHLAALALAPALPWLARTEYGGRPTAALLAGIWAWVAWAFHAERYATINWAATYFAIAFAAQAALLLWSALGPSHVAPRANGAARAALAVFAFAAFIQPFAGLAFGRNLNQAELFGLAPDPTAVATIALLALAPRTPWHLLIIPALWCVVTGLTLTAMQAPDALLTPLAGALALFLAAWKTRAA